jgi:unsaturated rhamnogalacturonyl hydrolase
LGVEWYPDGVTGPMFKAKRIVMKERSNLHKVAISGFVAWVFAAAVLSSSPVLAHPMETPQQQASPGDQPDDPGPLTKGLSSELRSKDIRAAMRKVADWQVARVEATPSQDWTYATLYVGLLSASKTLHEPNYEKVVQSVAEHYKWQLGPRLQHADDQAIGQAYLAMYEQSHQSGEIAPMRTQFDQVMAMPDVANKPVWWWCDALFMAPPAWAGMSAATGDHKYIDYMNREWTVTQNLLYDPQAKLFSRDANFLDKHEANGKKVFWSRGNGWVMGGIVRVLSQLPADDPSRERYVTLLKDMAKEVASIQSEDGLWRAGLLNADGYALPEVSGSAFFAYSIAWGVNHGYLDGQVYRPVVAKAWKGLLTHVYEDGRLGCIQPIGDAPGHYKPSSSYVFGVGAFLLAGSELDALSRTKPSAKNRPTR